MKKKLVAALCIAALAVGMFPVNVLAASSDSWKVDYTKGAPSGSANPVDYAYVSYDAEGFYSYWMQRDSILTVPRLREATIKESVSLQQM